MNETICEQVLYSSSPVVLEYSVFCQHVSNIILICNQIYSYLSHKIESYKHILCNNILKS